MFKTDATFGNISLTSACPMPTGAGAPGASGVMTQVTVGLTVQPYMLKQQPLATCTQHNMSCVMIRIQIVKTCLQHWISR